MSVPSLSSRCPQYISFPDHSLEKLENFLESRRSRDFVWEMAQMAKEKGYLTDRTEIQENVVPALGDPYWDPILYEYENQPFPIYWCLDSEREALLLVMHFEDVQSLRGWTACFLYYEFEEEAHADVLSTPFSFVPPQQMVENFKKLLNRETVVIETPPKKISMGWAPIINLSLRDLRRP